jgi:hypothetical protein
LGKQGKFAEAKMQIDEAQKIAADARNRFIHTRIVATLMTQTRPNISQAFPIRLDLINVSTSRGSIVEIENFPAELEIIEVSSNCLFQNGKIEFKDQTIAEFQVKTVKLIVKANSINSFDLKPQISYFDDSGQAVTSNPRPMTIAVQAGKSTIGFSSSSEACREVQSEGDEEIDILKRFGLSH